MSKGISTIEITELRRLIMSSFGILPKTVNDCHRISSLYSSMGYSISGHSIARILKILPERKTYRSTLDSLLRGLGFISYYEFSESLKRKTKWENPSLIKENSLNSFPLAQIELYILGREWEALKEFCELIEIKEPPNILDVMRFGSLIRSVHDQESLFRIIEIELTRQLLFHYFVDEDDLNGMYTKALLRHEKNEHFTSEDQLFNTLYMQNQKIYRTGNFSALSSLKDPTTENEHLISRFYENKIMRSRDKLQSKRNMNHFVKELELIYYKLSVEGRSWLIARCLKASSISGCLMMMLKNELFSSMFLHQYINIKDQIRSTADLMLQFFYFANKRSNNDLSVGMIRPMSFIHLNESHQRIAVESLQYQLLFKGQVSISKKTISTFRQSHQLWAIKALEQLQLIN